MERRTKLLLLILLGLLLLLIGLYFLLSPFLRQRGGLAPPAPTPTAPFVPTPSRPTPGGPVPVPTATGTVTAPTVSGEQRALENRARSAVERIGSGSSRDGFLGYQDVLTEMTEAGRVALLAEQQRMREAHPATGPAYGITTRGVSSALTQGKVGDQTLVVKVEAIQSVDAGNPRAPVDMKGKRIDVTFQRQGEGSYLIEKLEWSDLPL